MAGSESTEVGASAGDAAQPLATSPPPAAPEGGGHAEQRRRTRHRWGGGALELGLDTVGPPVFRIRASSLLLAPVRKNESWSTVKSWKTVHADDLRASSSSVGNPE